MSIPKFKGRPQYPVRKPNPPAFIEEREISHSTAIFDRFLGVVSSIDGNGTSENNVYIRPLFQWDVKWTPVQGRYKELVRWQDAPTDVRSGSLWAFGVRTDSDEYKPTLPSGSHSNGTQDKTIEQPEDVTETAVDPFPAPETLSVRTVGEEPVFVYEICKQENSSKTSQRGQSALPFDEIEAVRRRYIVYGVEVPPLGPVLVEIKNECVIGPLILNRQQDGKWRSKPTMVEVHEALPAQSFATLDMESGKRKIRLSTAGLTDFITSIDFRSDEETIADAIQELRKSVPSVSSNDLSQGTVSQLLAGLQSLSLPSAQPAEVYKMCRLENALERLEEGSLKEQWQYAILDTPVAQATLEIAKRGAVETALQNTHDALKEVTKQLCEQQALLTKVQIDLREREKRLTELKSQTVAAKEELADATDARIVSITTNFFGTLAELIVAKLSSSTEIVAEAVTPPIDRVDNHAKERAAPKSLTVFESSPNLLTWKPLANEMEIPNCAEAVERFRKRLTSTGFPGSLASTLVATWLADLVPVIAGTDGLRFLRCAAEFITAKRILAVSITADALSVADLFGKVHVQSRTYIPSPSGLADLLLAIDQGALDNRLGIVAFSGVNVTDTASTFLPLMEACCGAWEDVGRSILQLLHPSILDEGDPYAPLCRSIWPANLLPAFTLANGVSPLPPPSAFWENAALIIPCAVDVSTPAKQSREVLRSVWEEERKTALYQMPTSGESSNENLKDRRFIGGLLACGVTKEEAYRRVFLARRMPLLLSSGHELDDVPEGTDQSAIKAVRRALLYGSPY